MGWRSLSCLPVSKTVLFADQLLDNCNAFAHYASQKGSSILSGVRSSNSFKRPCQQLALDSWLWLALWPGEGDGMIKFGHMYHGRSHGAVHFEK